MYSGRFLEGRNCSQKLMALDLSGSKKYEPSNFVPALVALKSNAEQPRRRRRLHKLSVSPVFVYN